MGNLLQDGVAWLAQQMKASASQSIQYLRKGNSLEVAAVIGRSVFDVSDAAGGLLRLEARDYVIVAGDLVLNGAAITPQEGDQIQETGADGTPATYEVARFGSEPCWRFDPYRVRMVVHTRKVSQ